MQHILRCEGRREVYAFLNHYKETAFSELIQTKLDLAQFLVAREKGLEFIWVRCLLRVSGLPLASSNKLYPLPSHPCHPKRRGRLPGTTTLWSNSWMLWLLVWVLVVDRPVSTTLLQLTLEGPWERVPQYRPTGMLWEWVQQLLVLEPSPEELKHLRDYNIWLPLNEEKDPRRHQDNDPLWLASDPDARLVNPRLPPPVMLEVGDEAVPVTAVAVVVEVVVVVKVAEAVEAEAVVEVEAVAVVVGATTTTMTTETRHLRSYRDPPDDDDVDEPTGSSTTPRCSNNWPKSCKINDKRPRADALRVSRPPTPSRRPTKTDDAPLWPAILPACVTENNEYRSDVVERVVVSNSGAFLPRRRFITSFGWSVRPLSQTMVVSKTNVLLFQVLSRFPKLSSFVGDGRGCGGRVRAWKQFCSGWIDRVRNRGQRMERFQKVFFQSGHVSIRVHDLRKDSDRIENLRPRITLGRIGRVLDQDANLGQSHHGFLSARVRSLDTTVPQEVSSHPHRRRRERA